MGEEREEPEEVVVVGGERGPTAEATRKEPMAVIGLEAIAAIPSRCTTIDGYTTCSCVAACTHIATTASEHTNA